MLFYDIMNYNYPENKDYFKINPNLKEWIKQYPLKQKKFSKDITQQINFIRKYQKLFKYLPFVEAVYVCNSVSFKSVHNKSDIDLFIIISENKLHIWRLIAKLIFKLLKIEWNHQANKFCTGFWITTNATDLYPISIYPIDLYLAYWIAHLQPIYWRNIEILEKVFKDNIWVKQIISNYDFQPQNIIWVKTIIWESIVKKFLEKCLWFNWLNLLIGKIWKRKMLKIKEKLWEKWKDIIISDYVLKFFAPDKRKLVYLKYKSLKPKYLQKHKNQQTKWKYKHI